MDIVGIDEVGRGPWAGPLVAAAVLLRTPVQGLADSKTLTHKKREALVNEIQKSALAIGIGWIHARDIDRHGLTKCTQIAMNNAFNCLGDVSCNVIVDGNINYLKNNPRTQCLIGADGKVESVSAASIVAKVMRDRFMGLMSLKYPGYGFEKHVGYGTAAHKKAITELGATSLHRQSFKPVLALSNV